MDAKTLYNLIYFKKPLPEDIISYICKKLLKLISKF